jgi:simple sugar transport system permease protein
LSALAQVKTLESPPFWKAFIQRPEFITLSLIIVFSVVVGIINPNFLSIKTVTDTLRASLTTGIFALGVLLVLAAGGIDVSFTAIAIFALYSTTRLTLAVYPDAPYILMVVIALGMGLLMGLLNGYLVHRFKVPSLIVTIGTQYMFSGFLKAFIGSRHIMDIPTGLDAAGTSVLIQATTSDGARVSISIQVLVLILAIVVTWFILNRTLMGRAVYAVGGSIPIAERLGFNVQTVILFVFGYAGLLAGLGGMLHGALNRQANPSDLVGTELNVIAAVVLGGARITGGTGTVLGTMLGVILIELLTNNLILMGVPSTWQKVVIGAIILVASAAFARRGKTLS